MRFEVNDILLWPMLRFIPTDVLREFDRFLVFNLGSVVMLTKTGRIYFFPHSINRIEIKDISNVRHHLVGGKLNGHRVVQMDSSGDTVLAVTDSAQLFVFGGGQEGQLGLGLRRNLQKPVLVRQDIRMVRGGRSHVLALGLDGSVWSWGRNTEGQLGIGNETEHALLKLKPNRDRVNVSERLKPTRVKCLDGGAVVDIHCDGNISMAVTQSMHIYIWGEIRQSPTVMHLSVPTSLTLPRQFTLKQVAILESSETFYATLLLLTTGGEFWFTRYRGGHYCSLPAKLGDRVFGELIQVKNESVAWPMVAMAVQPDSAIAVLQSHTGKLYHWKVGDRRLTKATSITSTVSDVFALHGKCHHTHRLVSIPNHLEQPWSNTFNNSCYGIYTWLIQASNASKGLYVNYTIIRNKVPVFAKKEPVNRIFCHLIDQDYPTLFAFLRYIYTEKLWIESSWARSLHRLALHYQYDDLVTKCVDYFRYEITIEDLLDVWICDPSDVEILELIKWRIGSSRDCCQLYQHLCSMKSAIDEKSGDLVHLITSHVANHIEQVILRDPNYFTIDIHHWSNLFNAAKRFNQNNAL